VRSSALAHLLFSAMATSEQIGDEWWEKMMKVLDRLEDRLETVVVGQHRLQKQADRVAAAARKAQEREFLIVARTETAAHDMIDEMSTEKVVWDAEVLFDFDSHGLLQRLAQGEGDQTHNNCEQGAVSDVPCMLVGMTHQARTHLMFSEVGLKVAWDQEMQSETHMHEGLLKQLAQGGEDLEESTSKAADVEDVICNENMLHDFNSHNDLRQQLANDQVLHARSDNEIRDEETGHDELLDQLASNGNDVSASEQHCLAVSDDSSQECTRAQAEIIEEEEPPKANENHVLDDRQLQPYVLEASPACSTFERQNVMQHEASASSQGSLTSFEGGLTSYGDSVQVVGEHQLVSEESLEECKRDEVKRNIQDAVKTDGGYVLDCREFQLAASEVSSSENNMVEVQGAAQEEPLPLNGVDENSDKGDFVCKEQAQLCVTNESLAAQLQGNVEFAKVLQCQNSDPGWYDVGFGSCTKRVVPLLHRHYTQQPQDYVVSLHDQLLDTDIHMICRPDPCAVDRYLSVEEMYGCILLTESASSKAGIALPRDVALFSDQVTTDTADVLKRILRNSDGTNSEAIPRQQRDPRIDRSHWNDDDRSKKQFLLWIIRPWDPGLHYMACGCLGTSNVSTGR
jgi:hypothetical protein